MNRKPTQPKKSRYLTREQARAILDLLESPELPEHDSPFKLYFNGKLIGSATPPNQSETGNGNGDNASNRD